MSFRRTLQSQTAYKEGSLTLSKTSKFVSFSCLLWRLPVPFFSTNGKYKAYSFAWVVELSSIFVVSWNNAVAAIHFRHFWRILRYFLFPRNHSHINVLWASIRRIVSRNLSVSNPVYVVSIIYDTLWVWPKQSWLASLARVQYSKEHACKRSGLIIVCGFLVE